ncbi:globin [Caldibacillus lycopersici]|uniref:Globin n=1 Tax=Perspicuibacillus lycopersici TaxID=1325689 RepID=A0AAE3LM87_9BACI|nr:globin [Perspicuibacillus lycopersici]MCU9612432.1 globin [Perspicuibacillus lycopersici]
MENKYISQYEKIGENKLRQLVNAFYHRVGQHPDLAPIFPKDLTETARKQTQFLTQFLGGPPLYTSEHGHPRLRARHLPFPITPKRAESWLNCMREAMDEVELTGAEREELYSRLVITAHHMINSPDEYEEQNEKGEVQ